MAPAMVRAMPALARRTERDTVRRTTGKFPFAFRSRAILVSLLLLVFWGVPHLLSLPVQAQEKDTTLEGSGIHYPGGFDPNTVGEVQGRAYEYAQPGSGPVRFRLDTGKETYTVLASPRWYWSDLSATISDGTEVWVRGSKSLGMDGNLYIIAQEVRLRPSGKLLVFRDEDGYPLWKGPKMGAGGSQGGFSSPQRGMGGGAGGMGRGRR
jgi:hypothetical protein